jgi:hypothetical protein
MYEISESGYSKMAAAKQEISMFRVVNMRGMKLKLKYQRFRGEATRTDYSGDCPTYGYMSEIKDGSR